MNASRLNIVLVEDDALLRASIETWIGPTHSLKTFESARALLKSLAMISAPDLVLLDLRSPDDPTGESSIAAISTLRARFPMIDVAVQSGVDDLATMKACLAQGASRYFLKDRLANELPQWLERLAELRALRGEIVALLPGSSPMMSSLREELARLRVERVDVLLEGESGTGKELCARALAGKDPFVAVNMAAIPEDLFESELFGSEKGAFTGAVNARAGHFESAGSGVLFLDEIQSLSLPLQAKLLRALQERKFRRVGSNVERPFLGRVVSAANVPLRALAAKGGFREDLYYRLAGLTVNLPPLRCRGRDALELAELFVREYSPTPASPLTLSDEARQWIQTGFDWPGNVRELRHAVRALCLKSRMPIIDLDAVRVEVLGSDAAAIPVPAQNAPTSGVSYEPDWSLGFDENVERFEADLLRMARTRWNDATTLRESLKLSRSRYYELARRYKV